MEILPTADLAPSGVTILFGGCSCPTLPLIGCLIVFAIARNDVQAAAFALILAAIPFLLLIWAVLDYNPDASDPDAISDHYACYSFLGLTFWPLAFAALSLVLVIHKRREHQRRMHAASTAISDRPGA